MAKRWRGSLILLSTLLMVGYSIAQDTCSTLVETAIGNVADACYGMTRNQVCYGNVSLDITPTSDAPDFTFEQVGDIADVTYLRKLKLAPLDEVQGIWGIAMMQLQADIPDTLPGQNVTFLVFGDVELENISSTEQSPMQSFYLRTSVGNAGCVEAPDSGLLIQTPHGVQSVQFNINGVDVEIGSTVLLQANPEEEFTVRTLEGAAVVTMAGQSYPVIAGTEMSIPVNAQMQPEGLPSMPVSSSQEELDGLPIAPLPRDIPLPAPLPEAVEMKLQMRMEEGLEPCGIPGLPACEHSLTPNGKRVWAKKGAYAETPEDILQEANIILPMTGGEGNPAPVDTDGKDKDKDKKDKPGNGNQGGPPADPGSQGNGNNPPMPPGQNGNPPVVTDPTNNPPAPPEVVIPPPAPSEPGNSPAEPPGQAKEKDKDKPGGGNAGGKKK